MFQIFADEDESYRAAKVVLCIVVAAITLVALLGCGAKADEEITAAAEREAYDKKITFTMPIGYTATVTQCNPKCVTRYYYPRGK